jgi:hypothetical protein
VFAENQPAVVDSTQGQRAPGGLEGDFPAVELESTAETHVDHGEISGHDDVRTIVERVGRRGEIGEAATPDGRVSAAERAIRRCGSALSWSTTSPECQK